MARQWAPAAAQQRRAGAAHVARAGGGGHPSGANVRHGAVVAQPGMRFGVVVGRFNDLVTKLLLEGALGAFQSHGANMDNIEVRQRGVPAACGRPQGRAPPRALLARSGCQAAGVRQPHRPCAPSPALSPARAAPSPQVCWVPGSFELPVVAKAMAKSGKFDAVICIGVVVGGASRRGRAGRRRRQGGLWRRHTGADRRGGAPRRRPMPAAPSHAAPRGAHAQTLPTPRPPRLQRCAAPRRTTTRS
jgi:6,7-dimethyl-8-ribityllumazine synthase